MEFHLFHKQEYISRRQQLKQTVGSGIILLLGNDESPMNYKANWYPFKQDSSFLYYFGLNTAGLTAAIDIENNEEVIFGDELTVDDVIWTGPLPTLGEMATTVGVSNTKPVSTIESFIKKALNSNRTIHFSFPYRSENAVKLSEWLQQPLLNIPQLASKTLIKAIVQQRSIKSAIELVELKKAAIISKQMHIAAMQYAKPGMKEYELAAKVKEAAYSNQCSLSFSPIVTVHGEVLHNVYSGNTLQQGEIVLCDAGATSPSGYAGDLTCTFPVSNTFTAQQKELYGIVLNAKEHAASLLKPGILYKDIHLAACKKLVEGLTLIGLMKGNADDAVAHHAHTLFFQCGLGHMIGLDVHDMEDLGEEYVGYDEEVKKEKVFGLKSLRLGKKLQEGFALTVEPGLYFIPLLMDMWQQQNKQADFINYNSLHHFRNSRGIRIEEMYCITATGSELIGEALPKTVSDVETIRRLSLK